MEEWRDAPGYEEYYQVSSYGNVRSVDRYIIRSDGVKQFRKSKLMAKTPNTDGYLTVHLAKDGVQKRIGIHILVAKAFVDGYAEGLEVNHKDFDRTNNVPENLEWITHSENVKILYENGRGYAQKNDIRGENNPNYGNHILSEIYQNNKDLSIEKQSRPGSQNGRARAVKMIGPDNKSVEFLFLGECAQYMIDNGISRSKDVNNVRSHIGYAATHGEQYFNHRFEFI